MSVLDAYRVLGLEPDADVEQVESAYRRLIRANHPDVGGETAVAADINAAYGTVREWIATRPQHDATVAEPVPDSYNEANEREDTTTPRLAAVVFASAFDLMLMRLDFAISRLWLMARLLLTPSRRRRELARREAQDRFETKWWKRYGDRWDMYDALPQHGRRGILDYPRARLFESLRF